MEISRSRYFCVLARTGNMREAAELLRISPAALSKAMSLLTEEVGFPLFVPSGRGITITQEGREFARRAEQVLAEVESLFKRETEESGTRAKPLRIGSFEVFTTYFLGSAVEKHLAGTALEVHELIPGALEEALERGEIELGITYLPIPRGGVEFIEVGQVNMGIFGRKSAFGSKSPEEVPFVVPIGPIRGAPTRVQGLDGWPDSRIPRKVVHQVTLMETALELCRRGVAVAFLPEFIVKLHNRCVRSEFQLERLKSPKDLKEGSQKVYIVKRKSDPETAAARALARALRQALSS